MLSFVLFTLQIPYFFLPVLPDTKHDNCFYKITAFTDLNTHVEKARKYLDSCTTSQLWYKKIKFGQALTLPT